MEWRGDEAREYGENMKDNYRGGREEGEKRGRGLRGVTEGRGKDQRNKRRYRVTASLST